jgi:hydrogenase nickel incorporation protein HypA/HybF
VHELSICQALLNQVNDVARDAGCKHVEQVTIAIGPLAGVEPGLLASAFAVMKIDGCAAEATLIIESAGVEVECELCAAISPAAANRLICAACGGYRTRVVAGQELCLLRVELRAAVPARSLTPACALAPACSLN